MLCVFYYAEIYSNFAAASEDCAVCNASSARGRRTSLSRRHGDDEQICPRCKHVSLDSATVDEFTRHNECLDATVSWLCCHLFPALFCQCLHFFVGLMYSLSFQYFDHSLANNKQLWNFGKNPQPILLFDYSTSGTFYPRYD